MSNTCSCNCKDACKDHPIPIHVLQNLPVGDLALQHPHQAVLRKHTGQGFVQYKMAGDMQA